MKKRTTRQSVSDWVGWGARRLERAGVVFGHGTDNAFDEAAWLVLHALGLPVNDFVGQAQRAVAPAQGTAIARLIEERIATRKPAAYLTHEAWFAGLPLYVDERVLVPRSHLAEFIVQRFEPWLAHVQVRRALDLCTGSGCIALALARAFPGARVDATDISPDALAVARRNVERHGLGARVRLIESDLFAALAGERYDLIVTNPPYVDAAALAELPPEYRHEPGLGLAAGPQGLDVITRILTQAGDHLTAQGVLVAEVGASWRALERRFPDLPFVWLEAAAGPDAGVFLLAATDLPRLNPIRS